MREPDQRAADGDERRGRRGGSEHVDGAPDGDGRPPAGERGGDADGDGDQQRIADEAHQQRAAAEPCAAALGERQAERQGHHVLDDQAHGEPDRRLRADEQAGDGITDEAAVGRRTAQRPHRRAPPLAARIEREDRGERDQRGAGVSRDQPRIGDLGQRPAGERLEDQRRHGEAQHEGAERARLALADPLGPRGEEAERDEEKNRRGDGKDVHRGAGVFKSGKTPSLRATRSNPRFSDAAISNKQTLSRRWMASLRSP